MSEPLYNKIIHLYFNQKLSMAEVAEQTGLTLTEVRLSIEMEQTELEEI